MITGGLKVLGAVLVISTWIVSEVQGVADVWKPVLLILGLAIGFAAVWAERERGRRSG